MRTAHVVGTAVVLVLTLTAALVGIVAVLSHDPRPRPVPAAAPPPVTAPAVTASTAARPASAADPYAVARPWLARTATATGIPARALEAYARAHLRVAAEQPGCAVGWNTLAALGGIESAHGTVGGSALGVDGRPAPAILGPALDGGDFGAVSDTDDGVLDGDTRWDRAVGPMQFIPSTWATWAADGNGDGAADPQQIDDAALAAGRYLCHSGNLDDPDTWRRAVFSYNHSDTYVADIANLANAYAGRAA